MENNLKRRSFGCTDAEWKELKKIATDLGLSISQVIRIKLGFIEGVKIENSRNKD